MASPTSFLPLADIQTETAADISTDFLRVTRRGLLYGDFDAFSACFTLPHSVETINGIITLTSPKDMFQSFQSIRKHFAETNVTDLVRTCLAAEFITPKIIATTHQSKVMCGDVLQQKPYTAFSVLRRISGDWKISQCKYAISDNPRQNAAILGLVP